MKKCRVCKEVKPLTDNYFNKAKSNKDKLRNECKFCELERINKWNKEKGSEYKTWVGIKQRCYNENSHNYKNYGKRGIGVSDDWLESYDNFIRDMKEKPTPLHTIERVDNEGDYEKGNCVWATPKEQAQNRRAPIMLKNNTSGVTGVNWSKQSGKWEASITRNKTKYFLGRFDKLEDAANARKEAEHKHHKKQSTP